MLDARALLEELGSSLQAVLPVFGRWRGAAAPVVHHGCTNGQRERPLFSEGGSPKASQPPPASRAGSLLSMRLCPCETEGALVLLEAVGFACAREPFCEAETRSVDAGASLRAPGKHTELISTGPPAAGGLEAG